jgi:CRISPR-associated protein Cmr2
MTLYHRKLYALLKSSEVPEIANHHHEICRQLACFNGHLDELDTWWQSCVAKDVAASSDRVNLTNRSETPQSAVEIRHPISGQPQTVANLKPIALEDIEGIQEIIDQPDVKLVFWWFWRFYPELLVKQDSDALLYPAHAILPDCPLHSYQATVSALVGAMDAGTIDSSEHPYLLVFSFSPIQEFIKSSRKFLDFWAGSYLLHYLSARLCWIIAQELGPDALIVPSLWGQEIIDAFLLQEYPAFGKWFAEINDGKMPTVRFDERTSTSLSTAGFPNVLTILVPGKAAAAEWGERLKSELTAIWVSIGDRVCKDIRNQVTQYLKTESAMTALLSEAFPNESPERLQPYRDELSLLKTESNWEWRRLWEAQLSHTWEPYWSAVPLGMPGNLLIQSSEQDRFDQAWIDQQNAIARPLTELPSQAERSYEHLNVGTWWGSFQERLRFCLQAVKNTRTWQIPSAPGERSTISGQFSAVHPRLNYQKKLHWGKTVDFREGGGVPESSMRLFWLLMSKAYPGLFNGSEHLNALELTKRMAWIYGDVALSLGLPVRRAKIDFDRLRSRSDESRAAKPVTERLQQKLLTEGLIYERFLRFPNMSSIASARFLHDNPEVAAQYWQVLADQIAPKHRKAYYRLTKRCATQLPKTDRAVNPKRHHLGYLNGVMFSDKWLAEGMGLEKSELSQLRGAVDQTNRTIGFGESSPSDWWAIVLADGDGMGDYVSGHQLKPYQDYLVKSLIDETLPGLAALYESKKRMGPATHVGLNRALLDFSNRLVPYLTEHRYCGRVIYSGGDDVMAVLPLEDLPEYLLSLRSAWSGGQDSCGAKDDLVEFSDRGGYWHPNFKSDVAQKILPKRPLFTMGKDATMSMGVVIAHSSVPLPTVLESLWTAEKDRAKRIPGKDGVCFRVIYSSGNQLEATMKGALLPQWWNWVKDYETYQDKLSPVLYRLSEELPKRACVSDDHLFSKAAQVMMNRRDEAVDNSLQIADWLDAWEDWVKEVGADSNAIGTRPEDLGDLLRFTAFWIDKRVERLSWNCSAINNEERGGEPHVN